MLVTPVVRRYILCWLALAVIAIANGVLREGTYIKHMSELAAHQLSTVTAILATGAFVWWLNRVWPLESAAQAWLIGAIWLAMTIVFEFGFGFGHFVAGHTWSRLLADYDIFHGRVWILLLSWVAIMPFVIRRLGR